MATSTLFTAVTDPVLAAAVLARMSAAVFTGAVPLADQVPLKVRGALAVCLAVLALPAAGHSGGAPLAAAQLPAVVVGEAVVGLGLGLVAAAVVAAAAWAGAATTCRDSHGRMISRPLPAIPNRRALPGWPGGSASLASSPPGAISPSSRGCSRAFAGSRWAACVRRGRRNRRS